MQGAMEDFLRALRAADVKVSPVEAIDAHLTVATVGFADRELFKDALCATLAKTAAEVTRFDETFETFFARETFQMDGPPPGERGEPEGMPPEAANSELAQMLLNGDVSALAQAMEAAAERAQVSSIRLSTQRSRLTRRMLEEMGLAEIEQIIAAAKKLEDARSQALVARLESGKKALTEEAQRFVDRQHELYASESGKNLREELLARKALNAEGGIDPADLVMMQALVKKMAKRLADRYSRRRSKAQDRKSVV